MIEKEVFENTKSKKTVADKNKQEEKGRKNGLSFWKYIAYKVFPSALLGIQPLFIFYLVSSIVQDNESMGVFVASRSISVVIVVVGLVNIIVAAYPGTRLNGYSEGT